MDDRTVIPFLIIGFIAGFLTAMAIVFGVSNTRADWEITECRENLTWCEYQKPSLYSAVTGEEPSQ